MTFFYQKNKSCAKELVTMTITERVMYGWEMSAIATFITKGGKRTITASMSHRFTNTTFSYKF